MIYEEVLKLNARVTMQQMLQRRISNHELRVLLKSWIGMRFTSDHARLDSVEVRADVELGEPINF